MRIIKDERLEVTWIDKTVGKDDERCTGLADDKWLIECMKKKKKKRNNKSMRMRIMIIGVSAGTQRFKFMTFTAVIQLCGPPPLPRKSIRRIHTRSRGLAG